MVGRAGERQEGSPGSGRASAISRCRAGQALGGRQRGGVQDRYGRASRVAREPVRARRLPELDPEHYDDLLAILGRLPDQGSGSDCGRPALGRWMIREPVRLADEFGFEVSFPISRHLDGQRPVVGQNGLATLAVAVVGRRRRLVGTGGATQVVVISAPRARRFPSLCAAARRRERYSRAAGRSRVWSLPEETATPYGPKLGRTGHASA
jgi:hypothetical protein